MRRRLVEGGWFRRRVVMGMVFSGWSTGRNESPEDKPHALVLTSVSMLHRSKDPLDSDGVRRPMSDGVDRNVSQRKCRGERRLTTEPKTSVVGSVRWPDGIGWFGLREAAQSSIFVKIALRRL